MTKHNTLGNTAYDTGYDTTEIFDSEAPDATASFVSALPIHAVRNKGSKNTPAIVHSYVKPELSRKEAIRLAMLKTG